MHTSQKGSCIFVKADSKLSKSKPICLDLQSNPQHKTPQDKSPVVFSLSNISCFCVILCQNRAVFQSQAVQFCTQKEGFYTLKPNNFVFQPFGFAFSNCPILQPKQAILCQNRANLWQKHAFVRKINLQSRFSPPLNDGRIFLVLAICIV